MVITLCRWTQHTNISATWQHSLYMQLPQFLRIFVSRDLTYFRITRQLGTKSNRSNKFWYCLIVWITKLLCPFKTLRSFVLGFFLGGGWFFFPFMASSTWDTEREWGNVFQHLFDHWTHIFLGCPLLTTFHYFLNKTFSLIILVMYNLEMFYMIFIFKIIHRKLHQVWCSVVEYYF